MTFWEFIEFDMKEFVSIYYDDPVGFYILKSSGSNLQLLVNDFFYLDQAVKTNYAYYYIDVED